MLIRMEPPRITFPCAYPIKVMVRREPAVRSHVDAVLAELADSRNALANSAGFRITSVVVNGRKQLSPDEVLGIGGVNGRSSLLFLDAATVRDKLKANPWIADATVQKFYPGQLQIDLVERSAFALWQQDGRLAVIAEDGAVLEPYVSRRFVSLPLVVGKGAETRARDFLALLARYPQVHSVTKAAIFVGERAFGAGDVGFTAGVFAENPLWRKEWAQGFQIAGDLLLQETRNSLGFAA